MSEVGNRDEVADRTNSGCLHTPTKSSCASRQLSAMKRLFMDSEGKLHLRSYTSPFSSRDFRLWWHRGFRCTVSGNAGKLMCEVVEVSGCSEGNFQFSVPGNSRYACAFNHQRYRSPKNAPGSRSQDVAVLSDGMSCPARLGRTNRVFLIGVPWQQTGSF